MARPDLARLRTTAPLLPWLAATLLLAVVIEPSTPNPGIDGSWIAVLNGAFGPLQHGDDVVFNYGPYTYLHFPMVVDRGHFLLGLLAATAAALWTWAVCFLALRRCAGVVASAAAATLTAIVAAPHGAATAAVGAAGGTVLLLVSPSQEVAWRPVLLVRAGLWGLAAALIMQVKLSDGVAFAALAMVATLAARRPLLILLEAVVTGVTFALGAMLWWLLAGQDLGDLGSWFSYGLDLVSGYGDAMGAEVPPYLLGYLVAGAVVLLAVPTVLHARRVQPRAVTLAWILVFVVVLGFGVKSGFTRHDGHENIFFFLALVLFVVAAGLTGLSRAAGAGALLCLLMAFPGFGAFDPGPARDLWRADVEVVLRKEYAAELLATSRVEAQGYNTPPAILEAIGDGPVSIDPYEANVAWAYSLDYRPVPVFQNYTVVTERLDRLNARAVAAAGEDHHVLRVDGPGFQGRNEVWESPHYKLAVACNYGRVQQEGSWSLLAKVDARCAEPVVEGRQHVVAGEALDIPAAAADTVVTATFRPDEPSLLARLGHFLLKDYSPLQASIDGQDVNVLAHPATGPLMLSFPELGQGAFDPFAYDEVRFDQPGTVTFATVRIR